MIAALMAFLLGFSPNPANPKVLLSTSAGLGLAFSGFANTALALVASALFVAAAMTGTGLCFWIRNQACISSTSTMPMSKHCNAASHPTSREARKDPRVGNSRADIQSERTVLRCQARNSSKQMHAQRRT